MAPQWKSRIAGLLVTAGLLGLNPAQAYTNEELFSLSLSELMAVPVTGATLQPETLSSVPAAVTVFERKQIQRYGFRTLTELLNYVAGYQVQRSDTSAYHQSVSSRSLKANGDGRELLVLVDGQRLNNDWTGGANGLLSHYSLANVERVEVIKGPGSAIYGSNAYAGVINIITGMRNQARIGVGTDHTTLLQAQFDQTLGSLDLAGFVSRQDQDGDDYQVRDPLTAATVQVRDPFAAEQVYLKAGWGDFDLMASHQQNQAEDFYVLGFVSGEVNHLDVTQQYLRLAYRTELSAQLQLSAQAFVSRYRFDVEGRIAPEPLATDIVGTIQEEDRGVEAQLRYHGSGAQQLLLGLEYRHPELTDTDAYTEGFANQYLPQGPEDGRIIKGAFVQYQDRLWQDLEYILGARYDSYSNVGSHSSPRLGLNWYVHPDHVLKLLYGESFRAPSRSETDILNSSAIVANPDLQPEVFSNVDLIWQFSNDQTYVSAGFFYNEIEDAVRASQATPSMPLNEGSGHSHGVELEWLQAFAQHWELRANLMKLLDYEREFYTDADLAAGLILSYEGSDFGLSLLSRYQGSRWDPNQGPDGGSELGSRWQWDLAAHYALTPSLAMELNLYNLLDSEDDGMAYNAAVIGGVPEPGRSALLSFTWSGAR